jgi:hypothetical protein
VSVGLFGTGVLAHPTRTYIGLGDPSLGRGFADPSVYLWSLVWWPHAITHGLNPLVTHLVWAPEGFDLTRTTPVPGAALLGWPITALGGPILTYNVLMVLAPALGAWTAFLLCRHLTGAFLPSLVGGSVFGFSSYQTAQMTAHLNLSLTFLLPLATWLVLLKVQQRMGTRWFVGLMAGLLVLQFSFSTELFLTMTLFGGLALALAFFFSPAARDAILRTSGWLAVTYALAGVAVGPYLYHLATGGGIDLPPRWPTTYSGDLANLVVPTRTALVAPARASLYADRFVAGLPEAGAFMAPFLVVAVLFVVARGRGAPSRASKAILVGVLAVAIVAYLGPVLHVGGEGSMWLPWSLALHVPLVRHALPARLILFGWLAAAVISAMWLARPSAHRWRLTARWGLAGVCLLSLVPNVGQPLWHNTPPVPPFFAEGTYRSYLPTDRSTLIIPFGSNGFSMLWQAETDMAFPMAGGYIACDIPDSYRRWAIVATFISKERIPFASVHLNAFLGHLDVGAIVVDPTAPGPWRRVFGSLPVKPVEVGGVLVYRIPEELLRTYRLMEPANIAERGLERSCQ